jgi:hypothetical protein
VGEEGVEYKVHKVLLCEASEFFTSVPLPDDTPSVVELYVQWIYTRRIVCRTDPVEEEGENEHGEEAKRRGKNAREFDLLIGGFVFGEKVQDGNFKDAIIDALIHTVATPDERNVCWFPTKKWVTLAYTGTPKGSPIRRLLVDMFMFNGRDDWMEGEDNVDFLVDLGRRLLADRKADRKKQQMDPTRTSANSCQYHHHGEGGRCYSERIPGQVLEGSTKSSSAFNF